MGRLIVLVPYILGLIVVVLYSLGVEDRTSTLVSILCISHVWKFYVLDSCVSYELLRTSYWCKRNLRHHHAEEGKSCRQCLSVWGC